MFSNYYNLFAPQKHNEPHLTMTCIKTVFFVFSCFWILIRKSFFVFACLRIKNGFLRIIKTIFHILCFILLVGDLMSREFFHSDLLIYILMDDPRLEVSLKNYLIISFFSIKLSQFVKINKPEVLQKVSIMLKYLDRFWKVSANLNLSWRSKSLIKKSQF